LKSKLNKQPLPTDNINLLKHTHTGKSVVAPFNGINFISQQQEINVGNSEPTLAQSITQLYAEANNPFSFHTNTTQLKSYPSNTSINFTVQKKSNNTGLPDNLKLGIENLSGIDISDVKVNFNSSQPAQLNAYAFAQGNQIHIAPGQEKHLPHEAWHVVQQKQGRVKPTKQLKGKVNINDDMALEKEADVMGSKAMTTVQCVPIKVIDFNGRNIVQLAWIGDDFPKSWDSIIDGVQWFMGADNKLWYHLTTPIPHHIYGSFFEKYQGEANKKTNEEWDVLENQLRPIAETEKRIGKFEGTKLSKLSRREKASYDRDQHISEIRGEARTPVLHKDLEQPVEKENWVQVDDDLGSMPESDSNTKFINMFHVPQVGARDVDAVVMMENFRERAQEFFGSDAFFHQWMRVSRIHSVLDLPTSFPTYMYRNNISNEALAQQLTRLLGANDHVDVDLGSPEFRDLQATDNVKSTNNILSEYNRINALRRERPSQIVAMRIYRGPAIRFTIRKV
jgi:hypothetical protein